MSMAVAVGVAVLGTGVVDPVIVNCTGTVLGVELLPLKTKFAVQLPLVAVSSGRIVKANTASLLRGISRGATE